MIQGSNHDRDKKFFFSKSQTGSGGPPKLLFKTLAAPSPGLKQPDHENEYLIPSSVRLRMSGTIPPLPLYTLLHDSVYLCYLVYCSR